MSIDQVLRNELTPQQYDAAVDTAREVLCLACAGSGKSRTLAYRIARLLACNSIKDEILKLQSEGKKYWEIAEHEY